MSCSSYRSSVSALFYRVSVSVSGSFSQTISAQTSSKTELTTAQLSAKVSFKRADGSSYEIVEKSVVETVQRYSDMFSLFVKTKVVKSDFEAFGANLKTFFTGKLTGKWSTSTKQAQHWLEKAVV